MFFGTNKFGTITNPGQIINIIDKNNEEMCVKWDGQMRKIRMAPSNIRKLIESR